MNLPKLSLLIISGPTAVGKSSLAYQVATELDIPLISADSRQIFSHMTIGSGKDIPPGAIKEQHKYANKEYTVYTNKVLNIFGYDLCLPSDEYSIAHYHRDISLLIKELASDYKLIMIVGGSMQYIESIIAPPSTIHIPPHPHTRQNLRNMSISQLQQTLQKSNPQQFKQMNHSDRSNPRRLVRKIEIALNPQADKPPEQLLVQSIYWLGLNAPLSHLKHQIAKRVAARASQAFTQELEYLDQQFPNRSPQSSTAIGYQEWSLFLHGQLSKSAAIDKWQQREYQYAKRQLTWMQSRPHINQVDYTRPNTNPDIVDSIRSWYAEYQ